MADLTRRAYWRCWSLQETRSRSSWRCGFIARRRERERSALQESDHKRKETIMFIERWRPRSSLARGQPGGTGFNRLERQFDDMFSSFLQEFPMFAGQAGA